MRVPTVKRIVCLASSRMPEGRCIAGRELSSDAQPGPWVRPVSGRKGGGVSEQESRYEDGGVPSLLDIMDVPVLNAQPENHQHENWLLDPNHRWAKKGCLGLADLSNWIEEVETLWVNGCRTRAGQNDRVRASDANFLNTSLCFIKVNLTVHVVFDYYNRRRLQGRFRHKGTDYRMWVTDPDYEQEYLQQPVGTYRLGERYATISLGGVHNGHAYKLIAAIIEPS